MIFDKALNKARYTVFALLIFSVIAWLINTQIPVNVKYQHPSAHLFLEVGCMVLSSSVFFVGWNGYNMSKRPGTIVLAIGFLCVSLLDFFHSVSFEGMPDFVTPASMHHSQLFWLASRTIAAITLLLIATQKFSNELGKRTPTLLLAAASTSVVIISGLIFFKSDFIPDNYLIENGTGNYKIMLQMVLAFAFMIAAYCFYRQAQSAITTDTDATSELQVEKSLLFTASATMGIAELYFTNYTSTFDFMNITGHIYQLIADLCVYMSIITVSIRSPYLHLARAKQELTISSQRLYGLIHTATDGIITVNSDHKITLANPAAAAYFGYEPGQMLSMNLSQIIPLRHRHNHHHHVNQFGTTGMSIRQMGEYKADFTVTGLKSNGDEFPIEASISSLIEDNQRFYTVIFRDISERKTAKDRMEQYQQELSHLSTSLQTIREEERKYIARELHDDLGQLLAALRMDLTILKKRQDENSPGLPIIASMDQLILTSITSLRRIATDLRPRALDEGGLFFALKSLQKEFRQRHGIDCDLHAIENELVLNDNLSTTVYRVIQESLTNVARHASASRVTIQLEQLDDHLHFKIQDNGRGIAQSDFSKKQSLGLVGIRERVRAMQGKLSITASPENGTCIEISLPIE